MFAWCYIYVIVISIDRHNYWLETHFFGRKKLFQTLVAIGVSGEYSHSHRLNKTGAKALKRQDECKGVRSVISELRRDENKEWEFLCRWTSLHAKAEQGRVLLKLDW
jgi:hypothetical protein